MNTYLKIKSYVEKGRENEVSFLCFPSKDGSEVYPKEINCLELDNKNQIRATSRAGSYLITSKNNIVQNIKYKNLFHVYGYNEKEVLTIEIK